MVRPTSPAHAPRLTLYRTGHFRPLAPNPSTSPRAAPRNLGRSRTISGDLGAAPRYLGGDLGASLARRHTCSFLTWCTPRDAPRRRRELAVSFRVGEPTAAMAAGGGAEEIWVPVTIHLPMGIAKGWHPGACGPRSEL